MNIQIIEGDLLNFPRDINVIAHSCNNRNIMGAGIAKQIKDRYPKAYEADWKAFNSNSGVSLGKFSKAEITDWKYIYNMYTQSTIGTGREVNYEKFWQALKEVEQDLCRTDRLRKDANKFTKRNYPLPVLGLPHGISCGLAGGNWGIIKAMIDDIFLDSPIKCYIVKFDELEQVAINRDRRYE